LATSPKTTSLVFRPADKDDGRDAWYMAVYGAHTQAQMDMDLANTTAEPARRGLRSPTRCFRQGEGKREQARRDESVEYLRLGLPWTERSGVDSHYSRPDRVQMRMRQAADTMPGCVPAIRDRGLS
jgi:hypothetical protein